MPVDLSNALQKAGRFLEGEIKRPLRKMQKKETRTVRYRTKGGKRRTKKEKRWVRRSPFTTLRSRSTALRRSITVTPQSGAKRVRGGFQVKVGPHEVYGAIHEYGGRAGRGHRTIIKARPYVAPVVRKNRRKVTNIIIKHIKRRMK
jgi:phage gpG-like protein